MAEIPHFGLPFRIDAGGHAAVNEQDTVEDVAACVEAALRTEPGERDGAPAFGVPEQTFNQLPLDLDAITDVVTASEPRARVLAQDAPEALDEAIRRVRMTVSTRED